MGIRRLHLGLEAVQLWQASAMTQAEFCRQHGYKRATFSSWVKRHQPNLSSTSLLVAPSANPATAQLTLVATQWPTPKPETLQLRVGNDVDLTLPTSTCTTWLATLLRALA